jgi:ribonucleoside-diphosphate reductase alpha chain
MRTHSPDSISALIWDWKYRLKSVDGAPLENSIAETVARVADALSAQEGDAARWSRTFQDALADFQLIPAGRISAGAGTARDVTLVNTFMSGPIPDDFTGIYQALAEGAETLRRGGGIGCDFSALRPYRAAIRGLAAPASGPLPYMDLWDRMCLTTMLGGLRRGAMMAMLRCDHPNILDFVAAKHRADRLCNFNLSVLVTDDFIAAVRAEAPWALRHNGRVYGTVPAAALWRELMQVTYAHSEPGVLFIDRMNALNNLRYCETLSGTNSCGEQPLPPYGSCPLASVNLARLVEDPFRPTARMNIGKLVSLVAVGVRMLDNVLQVTAYPLAAHRREAHAKRRVGLGVTGLADALLMCGVAYGSHEAVELVAEWMEAFQTASYLASVELAEERGPFPLFDREQYLAAIAHRPLPTYVTTAIRRAGIRNGVLSAIAPTGTMSLYAGNVSSGIEPVYSFATVRQMIGPDGDREQVRLLDYAYALYSRAGDTAAGLPPHAVTAGDLTPVQHLAMQATVQRYIDASISKTINCPADMPFESFEHVYLDAFRLGCKGCTSYRPSPVRGHVLLPDSVGVAEPGAVDVAEGVGRTAPLLLPAD